MKFLGALCTAILAAAFSLLLMVEGRVEVFGYVPDYRFTTIDWEHVFPYVTTIILFSLEVSPRGDVLVRNHLPETSSTLWRRIKDGAARHGTKILATVGGTGRTAAIDLVVKDPSLRKNFESQIVTLVEERKLDGVDLNVVIPDDKDGQQVFAAFLKSLKSTLKVMGKTLTMAVHPGPRHALPKSITKEVDFLHFMAYDNWCAIPVTATPPCRHSELSYAKSVVNEIVSARQFAPGKSSLGIPIYGRHTFNGTALSYREIYDRAASATGTLPPSVDELDEFAFNGKDTIAKKISLAVTNNLGGVMLWELGQDLHPLHPSALLPHVHDSIEAAVKAQRQVEL